jgi:ribosomal protein L2
MADRRTHNDDIVKVLGIKWKEANAINAKVDSTVKTKGKAHREDYHSLDMYRKDSLEVTGGRLDYELARRIHIARDTDPGLKKLAKLQQALRLVK